VDLLVDTNVLLRAAQKQHPQHEAALAALNGAKGRGDRLYIVPQVLYEFWVVATRPIEANGLGLTTAQSIAELHRIRRLFPLLPETPQLYSVWEQLVYEYSVLGKQAHDARLVAAMRLHGLEHILTFNTEHLARFAGLEPIRP
jgi:predicted nucleic acid-binding protein